MTMPLALGVISARLSATGKSPASNRPVAASDSKAGLQGLDVLFEALEVFVSQYQCVGFIHEVAKHVANLAQDHSSQAGDEPRTLQNSRPGRPLIITDWTQILTAQPYAYVRTTMAVDLYLSKGRVPQQEDFPAWLFRQPVLRTGRIPRLIASACEPIDSAAAPGRRLSPSLSDPKLTWPWSSRPPENQVEEQQLGSFSGHLSPVVSCLPWGRAENDLDLVSNPGAIAAISTGFEAEAQSSWEDFLACVDFDSENVVTDHHGALDQGVLQDIGSLDYDLLDLLGDSLI